VTDKYPDFTYAWDILKRKMIQAPKVVTERWQGVDAAKNPSMATYELLNVDFSVPLRGISSLDHWRADIGPNTPWADNHFEERVCGSPLNPGEEWKNWPWASSADKFRSGEIFNHTYAERLWPKFPRRGSGGRYTGAEWSPGVRKYPEIIDSGLRGIGWTYGDLQDLVELLAEEPYTRQAWIPLFFPEDTGKGDGGRKPCTLGYQIIVREGVSHIWYPLRSCDLKRHFRDDCYLAVRLLLWITEECKKRSDKWKHIEPATYSMHCTSLHIFANDRRELEGGATW